MNKPEYANPSPSWRMLPSGWSRRASMTPAGHQGLVDVSGYPADTEVPWFRSRVKCAKCAKCGGRGNKIDVRPNWKEQPPSDSLTGKVWR